LDSTLNLQNPAVSRMKVRLRL